MKIKENSALTQVIAQNTRTNIVPINELTFLLTPADVGPSTPPPVYIAPTETAILVSEEDFTGKDLLRGVFEDGSSIHFQKFSTKDAHLMALIEDDITLLAELYQLLEEHQNVDSSKLLEVIKSLSVDFSADHIIAKLMAAPSMEIDKLVEISDPTEFKKVFLDL